MKNKSLKVGVIGYGIIGSRVARRIKDAGYDVRVWNRTKKNAEDGYDFFVDDLSELINFADVIQIYVTNGQVLKSIINSVINDLTDKHVILNHSTVDIGSTLEVNDLIVGKGAKFYDAPFTGSKIPAESGELVYYLSGNEDLSPELRKLLDVSSRKIVQFDKVGDGTLIKVATNLIAAGNVKILSESLALTRAYGMADSTLARALDGNVINSKIYEMKLGKVLEEDYDPHFTVNNMFKDIGIAMDMAKDKKCEVKATNETLASLKKLVDMGEGELDFAALGKKR